MGQSNGNRGSIDKSSSLCNIYIYREGVIKVNLGDYESHLRFERQLATTTIANYISFVKEFLQQIKKHPNDCKREDVKGFIEHLRKSRCLSNSSVSNYVIVLRSYYTWLADLTRDQELIEMSFYLSNIVKIKRDSKVTVVPTPEEVAKLRKALQAHKAAIELNKSSPLYKLILRDSALIELLITTGIRSNELRNLKVSDIFLEDRIIIIRVGKGSKQRVSTFTQNAQVALKEYLEESRLASDDLMFPIKQGNMVNYIILRWAKRAGINTKIHAHSFRHYFITESQRQGVSIEVVADQVGHRSLNTTRGYTHHNIEYLKDRYKHCNI